MAIDALVSSHPLSSPADEVNTPAQISEVFDSISYSKVLRQWGAGRGSGDSEPPPTRSQDSRSTRPGPVGVQGPAGSARLSETPPLPQGASVLRMLSSFLTEDLFKKGVAVSTLGRPWGVGFPQHLLCVPEPLPTAGGQWEKLGSSRFALTVACLSTVLPPHLCLQEHHLPGPVGPPAEGQ